MAKREKGKGGRDRSERDSKSRREKEPQNAALEWVKSIAIAVVLFLFLRTFLVQTVVITSGSMEETLLVGDHLLQIVFQ